MKLKNSDGSIIAFGVLLLIAVFVGSFLFGTWILMLLLGAVHSFIPVVPALGFLQTALVSLLLSIVGGLLFKSN